MDQGKARDVSEAARRFAETLADSYRLVYGQASESAQRQQQRAQEFSELVSRNLSEQAEAGRANVEQLSEQAQRQGEAGQALARESVEAYTRFLDDAVSRYRPGAGQAAEGARAVADTAQHFGVSAGGRVNHPASRLKSSGFSQAADLILRSIRSRSVSRPLLSSS